MPTSTLDEDSIEISLSERFQPRNDDSEVLWEVKAIISEKPRYYKVEWVGIDPATGKKWSASWVRKGDVTDDLVKKWKLQKRQQQEEKAARKRRKSGKRDSTMSAAAALASRSTSTRRSASTVKALTPATSVSGSSRLSGQPDVTHVVSRNGKLSNHETHSSPKFKEPSPLLEELESLKRKRDSSIRSASVTSLPQITAISHSPPVTRPRKKRRVGSSDDLHEISEEDTVEIQRPTKNGLQHVQVVVDVESEEEVRQNGAKEKFEASKKNGKLKKGKTIKEEQEQEVEEDDDEVEVVSSPPKGAKSRHQPRPTNGPKKRVFPIPRLSPTRQKKDSNEAKQKAQQMNGVTRTQSIIEGRSKEANYEPSVRGPLVDARIRPTPKRRARELSPDTLQRLKRFDTELDELERERKRQGFNAKSDAGQEHIEEEDESGLEYVSPAVPVSSLPSRKSPNLAPATQTTKPVPRPRRHSAPKIAINGKTTDDSFRQGIVPETEPEESQSQPISQPVPSLPSMLVEPPTSLNSRPSTPSQAQTSRSRPGSSDARSKPSAREQPPSQDADISTTFDSIEPESQEVPIPSKPILYPTTAEAQPSADSSNRAGGNGAEDLTSSIEQFSSPEKPRVGKEKTRKLNGRERSPAELTTIRSRGQQLAETAWLAKLYSRPQVAKRPLSEVIAQKVQHSRSVLQNGLPLTSVPHAILPSTLESVPSPPNPISHTVIDSNRGMPEVPEEVVQELEAALIDLDGGTNKQTEDDTLEDRSTSLQKLSNHSATTNASSVFALRQEEEESTQDLLREAAVTAAEVQVTENLDVEMDDEPIPPRNQERQPSEEAEPAARGSPRLAQARSPSVVSAVSVGTVGPPQRDLGKQPPLDNPLSPLASPNSELREIKAVYDRDKVQWQAELASLKAEWEAERASLTALAETTAKAKEDAIKESNFFREQYARASAFVTSVRDENVELEKRAKIAEDQAKSGVAMVKVTFESRIKELEQHVEKWQMMATFLIQKDQRTDNDELRRRAAEEPELRERCKTQEEDIFTLNSEIIQLEEELKHRDKLVEDWKQDADRLAEQLNDCKAEVERLTRAAAENEMVYRCLWRLESDKPCEGVFSSAEDLKAHLYSAGHITWD